MASDQSSDQELQFKKRARRRLVGAIALVLLMVTILPMVLDDRSSKTPPQEIAINIPSQDGPEFTSKVAPQGEPVEEVVSEPVLSMPESPDTEPDFEAAPVQPAPKQEPVKKDAAKPEAKPVAPKVETSKAEAPKAEPAKQKPADAKPAATGSFLVQIGVFSDPINVKNLQDKLSGQGLKSHTEVIATASGDKTRLRVGPFASREAAEQALGKVKAAGLSGMVISNK
ncbi:SPOR domain-containing protein [Methylobacillus flagellatus]|uniref:SPOR domain-containing protein n=1 Tax=Methylobacillus flagellatus TaxID=405 RepID=UPI002853CAC1|nr:SPOR domain-containing protein [Methylobacillus flagellatus]MDR5171656.1 SPOR domain-containing protein [Methylobacillus flagellatus]